MQTAFLVDEALYRRLAGELAGAPALPARVAVLERLCACNRINALGAIVQAGRGWLGASFSCAELLTALYWEIADVAVPGEPARDLVVLGKGHAAAMQYAALAGRGLFPVADLRRYKHADGPQAHADLLTPGIATNTGSLGQALSKCVGLALGNPYRVFVLLGDGELQEGQNYEALMSLRQHHLANLTVIVDVNRIQSDSEVADIKALPDLEAMFRAFGLQVLSVDGNDLGAALACLRQATQATRPTVVLAHTRKGAGVGRFAAQRTPRRGYVWHGGVPNPAEYAEALRELLGAARDPGLAAALDDYLAAQAQAPAPSVSSASARRPSTGDALGAALVRLAREGRDLLVLDADLEKACRLTAFAEAFPERFLEMGIAEQDMVSTAGGLALRGRLPVVNTYAAFLRRAFEQIYVNATERTRIVYAGHYAGLCYTPDGKTHQCTGDVAMMRSIPGMIVLYPACAEQVEPMLRWYLDAAVTAPLYLRLHRLANLDADVSLPPPEPFRVGELLAIRRCPGATAAVLTCGPHLTGFCARAADRLAAQGTAVDVWTAPTLRGLAPGAAADLAGYAVVAVVEELVDAGGLLDEVAHALARHPTSRAPRLRSLAVDDFTFSTLERDGLYAHFGLTAERLLSRLQPLFAGTP
jgi:transketolase